MLALWLCLLWPAVASGQRETRHATTFGIGGTSQLDTYLSPLAYTGPQLTVMNETLRPLVRNAHVLYQTQLIGNLLMTDNAAQNADMYGGEVRYEVGWMREWTDVLFPRLRLAAGGMAMGNLGFLYNTRNGNNPAQGYLGLQLAPTLSATYTVWRLRLRYQATLPVLGAMFSPQYGQSYYEMFSLHHYDHNIRPTHPGNALSVQQLLTVDLPLRRCTLRLGYLSQLHQARVNHLRQHHYARSFMIGYVRELTIKRPSHE